MKKRLFCNIEEIEQYYNFEFLDYKTNTFFEQNEEKESISNNVSITGHWGNDKSTLIEHWIQNHTQKSNKAPNNKYKFIKINIWEYELSSYPIYSILYAIYKKISPELNKKLNRKKREQIFKFWRANFIICKRN